MPAAARSPGSPGLQTFSAAMQYDNVAAESEPSGELSLFPRRVRKTEVIYATTQLSIMLSTGISLSAALGSLAEQEESNAALRDVLLGLRKSVEAGDDFSAALSKYPRCFDRTYVSLIKASEATGQLPEMLEQVAQYLQKQVETAGKVRASMAYPTVMLLMAIGVTIFLLTYVLPKFTPIFEGRGVALPRPTRALMFMSDLFIDYWYGWVVGVVALTLGFVFGRRTEQGREIWDAVRIRIPVIGPALKKVILSRTIRSLGVMVSGGVSIVDALTLAAEVSGHCQYERSWRRVIEEVIGGNEIHVALRNDPLFPKTLVQMIASGEETGKLGDVLERVSRHYDQEVELSLKTATSLIEPLMIAAMGAIVGGIGLALLLPIFSLSRTPG